jgi:hypothetical protein
MNLKKLGIVLFLLIAVAGFSMSLVNADFDVDEYYHLKTKSGDLHQVSFTAPQGYIIADISNPNDKTGAIEITNKSVGNDTWSYTFTGKHATSSGTIGIIMRLYNEKTHDTKYRRYTFDVGFNNIDLQINGPDQGSDGFKSLDTSIWTSKYGEKWTANQIRNRDPKLGRGQNATFHYDLPENKCVENLQLQFRVVLGNCDGVITLRIKDYDGSLIIADKINNYYDNSPDKKKWVYDGKMYYKNVYMDLSGLNGGQNYVYDI